MTTSQFPLVLRSLKSIVPLGSLGAIFSLLILASYELNIEMLHRPSPDGPGTHPLTAFTLFLLGIGICCWRPFRVRRAMLVFTGLACLLAASRLVEILMHQTFLSTYVPFQPQLQEYSIKGNPVTMGINSAVMVLLFGVSLVLNVKRKHKLSTAIATMGLGIPFVSLVGHAYGVDEFYGEMSSTTILAGVPIGIATILTNSHRGGLRAILSPWIGGKIARIKIALGVSFTVVLGLMIKDYREALGIHVVVMSLFIVLLISFSAIYHEKNDAKRRSLERKLALSANTDMLTLLWSRHFFYESALLIMEHVKRENESLSILIIDIDHFKHINDSYGHLAGDNVLKAVSNTMRKNVRKQDMCARYGGEEFVILLPGTDLRGAVVIAEKLRTAVANQDFDIGQPVTISVGCAEFSDDAKLEDFINRADQFLYQAKLKGRNRVASQLS